MRITAAFLFIPSLSFGFNAAQEMRETVLQTYPDAVVEARMDKSITMKSGNKYIVQSSISPLHISGTETEIDTAWVNHTGTPYFKKMVLSDYHAYAGLNSNVSFGAGQIIRYEHPGTGEYVTFQPQDLNWINEWDSTQFISSPQNISAEIEGNILYWAGAYGSGRNFRWQTHSSQLKKDLILDSLSNLGSPPGWMTQNLVRLQLKFLFEKSDGVSIWVWNGNEYQQWNETHQSITNTPIEFRYDGVPLWYFMPAKVIDARGEEALVDTRLTSSGGVLFVEVLTPWTWLQNAEYPVHVDPSIDNQINAGANDAHEPETEWTFSYNDQNLNLIAAANNYDRWMAGFRFENITVPQGATITQSFLQLYQFTAAALKYSIVGNDVDNSADFATESDVVGRTRTSAESDVHTSSGGSGSYDESPSLNDVIQEIVDREGWENGNALTLIAKGATNSSTLEGRVRAYEGSTSLAAKIYIEYTESAPPAAGGIEFWIVD